MSNATVPDRAGRGHRVPFLRVLLFLLLAGLGAAVQGAPAATADPPESPSADTVIRHATEQVLAAVEAHRERRAADPRPLRREVDRILDGRVDFARIARGVMGRHAPRASAAQQIRFADVFRSTLVRVYTNALVAFEARTIDVGPEQRLAEHRARVAMRITTDDGRTFVVHYAMGRDDAGWQVRNLVVDGINLGLTFRNQFEGAMQASRGDLQAVIDGWAPAGDAVAPVTVSEVGGAGRQDRFGEWHDETRRAGLDPGPARGPVTIVRWVPHFGGEFGEEFGGEFGGQFAGQPNVTIHADGRGVSIRDGLHPFSFAAPVAPDHRRMPECGALPAVLQPTAPDTADQVPGGPVRRFEF